MGSEYLPVSRLFQRCVWLCHGRSETTYYLVSLTAKPIDRPAVLRNQEKDLYQVPVMSFVLHTFYLLLYIFCIPSSEAEDAGNYFTLRLPLCLFP